jgi:cytochrome c
MTPRALMIAAALALGGLGAGKPALAAPDAMRGEAIYARCLACHALAYDRVGPRHCGLLGRRAGSVRDFAYSPAMKQSAIVWDEKALDRFLAAPMKALPGTTMTYDGVPDRRQRADLIAYLRQIDRTPACRGTPPLQR